MCKDQASTRPFHGGEAKVPRPEVEGNAGAILHASYSTAGVMQAELETSIRALRDQFFRASRVCPGVEHDALVKAQERLSEAEMWINRAIGRA